MKTVTIPTCANPFVVIVNGIKYTYPAGATVSVPDDVAAVIEQHDEAHNNPAPAPVVPPFVPETSEGSGGTQLIDLGSYVIQDGITLGSVVLLLFSSGGGYTDIDDNTTFWADVNTDKTIKLVLDVSAIQSGSVLEGEPSTIMRRYGDIIFLQFTNILPLVKYTRSTLIFEHRTSGQTRIAVHVEEIDVQST